MHDGVTRQGDTHDFIAQARGQVTSAAVDGVSDLARGLLSGCGDSIREPDPVGGPAVMRRLTEGQYRATIASIFGPDIAIPARFERGLRADGLIAIGTGEAGMSPFSIGQYDAAALGIAAAVASRIRTRRSSNPIHAPWLDRACYRPCRKIDNV